MRSQNGPRGLLAELSQTRGLCWPARHQRSPMSLAAPSIARIIPNEFAANLAFPAHWVGHDKSLSELRSISSVQGEWHDRLTRGKDCRLAGERLYSCSRSGMKHPHTYPNHLASAPLMRGC